MNPTWLINANHSYAQIFSFSGSKMNGAPKEVASLCCPEARQHEHDLVTDSAGRSFDSGGKGRHAMEPHSNIKEQIAKEFAKDIADRIEKGRQQHKFENLILVAPPDFLGDLRAALDPKCRELITYECKKNLFHHDLKDVAAHMPFPLDGQMKQALRSQP